VASVVLALASATAVAQDRAKPPARTGAAAPTAPASAEAAKAPRSTYTGKAKLEKGFVVLPDGRKIAVPSNVKAKLPGAGKMNEWPETTGQADEGMQEVAAVADEMIAEEVSKRDLLQRVNPGALRGKVIKAAGTPAATGHNPAARSTHTAQAKLQKGFVVLPDGRQVAVPGNIKSKMPGAGKMNEWPETTGQADEGMLEVAAVADEMVAEEVTKRDLLQRTNPAALKGKVIRAAQPATTSPATQQPATKQPAAKQPAAR
jgi:hypothetical protein